MSITIGGTTFDRVRYDAEGDVLYLHVGDPSSAVDFDESPEGHALRFDAERRLVGLTIVNARWLLDQGGRHTIAQRAPAKVSTKVSAAEMSHRTVSRWAPVQDQTGGGRGIRTPEGLTALAVFKVDARLFGGVRAALVGRPRELGSFVRGPAASARVRGRWW
jgi:uncharacterized protein YuzE